MTPVPVIDTPRLRLRGMAEADFPAFAGWWADPRVIRYILAAPRPMGDSWRSFLGNAGSWALTGIGQWGIEERSSGRLVGHAGFFRALRGLGDDFDAAPECGWVLAPEAWGRGIGQEALEAAHGWFDQHGPGPDARAMIEVGHTASERLAARLGYSPFRVAEVAGGQVTLFRREVASKAGVA